MFVEAQAIVAETIDFLPGVEVLRVGSDREVGVEVTRGERVGEFVVDLQVVEVFAIGEKVEDEDFHDAPCVVLVHLAHEVGEGVACRYQHPLPALRADLSRAAGEVYVELLCRRLQQLGREPARLPAPQPRIGPIVRQQLGVRA
jgi:hypothetical protein